MMNAVHTRRNNYVIQHALQTDRQPPVGMMKERRAFERDEEHEQHYRSNTEERDCKRKKAD